MSDHYEVVFRGDIAPGHHITDVRQNLAALFKTDLEGVAHLFSGKLVIVKGGLSEAAAQRYKTAMEGAGALVSIRSQQATTSTDNSTQENAGEFAVAPVGSDVLPQRTKFEDKTQDIATDHLSVAETGSDVLKPEEKQPFQERKIDTSHLDIE